MASPPGPRTRGVLAVGKSSGAMGLRWMILESIPAALMFNQSVLTALTDCTPGVPPLAMARAFHALTKGSKAGGAGGAAMAAICASKDNRINCTDDLSVMK